MRLFFACVTRYRMVRVAVLGIVVASLAGCATGYTLVQPAAAGSGAYYAGAGAYPGQGFYDSYGSGPYYPDAAGWGYYDGTSPYWSLSGGYGGFYGDWPTFGFNLGISGIWGFPGYWGPWYSTGLSLWPCRHRGCSHRHDHHHHGRRDHLASTSPRPRVNANLPATPPRWARAERTTPPAMPSRPRERMSRQWHSVASASFAPHDFARGPVDGSPRDPRPAGMPPRPVDAPPDPQAFGNPPVPTPRPRMATPNGFSSPARGAFRPAPTSLPASHRGDAPRVGIH
jgi:hypothetical protein